MEQLYTVITDNGGGPRNIYHDITGQVYTFPPRYKSLLLPGTKVVYHRAAVKKVEDRITGSLSNESHYFGIAEIGKVTLTSDGNYRADITNYIPFKFPVNIHRINGTYFEGSVCFQQGVRKIDKSKYEEIYEASNIQPSPITSNLKGAAKKKTKGHKSTTSLIIGLSSGSFSCNGNAYEVVTGREGYYLKSHEPIFYELRKLPNFNNWRSGNLRVLSTKNNDSFVIIHNQETIGFLNPITNGLKFEDSQSKLKVNICM